MNYDCDESEEEVDLLEIRAGDSPAMTIGIGRDTGNLFLRGDLHPLGSATALITAAAQHVPYIAVSAVEVLYPSDWLRGECAGNIDRQRIITNLENYARSGFSNGSRTVQ